MICVVRKTAGAVQPQDGFDKATAFRFIPNIGTRMRPKHLDYCSSVSCIVDMQIIMPQMSTQPSN